MGTIINFRGVDIKHGDYIELPDGWMLVVERSGGGWVLEPMSAEEIRLAAEQALNLLPADQPSFIRAKKKE